MALTMALYWLTNNIRLPSGQVFAGTAVDDAQDDTAAIASAGGKLFPQGNATVDSAAVQAQAIRARGGSPDDMEGVMNAAVDAVQGTSAPVPLASVQVAPVTLVGGTATESALNYTAESRVVPIRNTAAGTPGDLSVGTVTPGEPGSAVINSASGTDTSTVLVLVIG